MKTEILAGTVSHSRTIFIADTTSTTGAGLGSLVYNSAGLTAKYRRQGQSAWTTITLATMTAGTWVSGGFVADGGGVTGNYELGIPNAAVAAGAEWVIIQIYGATNALAVQLEIDLVQVNKQDPVRAGLTALPNAAAEAAGGLFTRGTGAGQINQAANGMIDVNPVRLANDAQSLTDLKDFADAGYDPLTHKLQGVVNTDELAGEATVVLADGSLTAAKIAADAITDAKVASDVTIASVTGAVGSVTAGVTISGTLTTLDAVWAKIKKYFQLLFRKDAAIATDNATEVAEINANGGSGAGGFLNTNDSVKAIRDRGDAAWTTATGFSTLDAADVRAALGLASANLDTQFDAIPTASENAVALLDLSSGVETSITLRQALRLILAASAGKLSGASETTLVIRNVGDTKNRITATVDADGNRSAVVVDAT